MSNAQLDHATAAAAAANTNATINAIFAIADQETADVMKERIAESSRAGYIRRNITWVIWLLDNPSCHHLLEPSKLASMKTAEALDKATLTKAGQPSKARKNLRNLCRKILDEVNPAVPASLPVKLEHLTFTIFSRFLTTFKKTVTRKKRTAGSMVVDEEEVEIRLSIASYDGACSALSHLYLESGLDKNKTSAELWARLSAYKKGSRRRSTKEKKKLGLSTTEGKKPLPFSAYRLLAMILFTGEDPEFVGAHNFLIQEWNLISRAEYLVESKIDLISVGEDALLYDIGKTKCDQDGTKNVDHPWHVYANPLMPEICPVLAMGRYIICNPTILSGQCDLFEGSSQYDRFNKIFNDIVDHDDHRQSFISLGIPPEYFGTHSIRKGAVTLVATGSTASPPIASICLRANWAMPGVMNRYIRFEAAGDQFVGRSVSGLPRNTIDFATSPAYFDFTSCNATEREENTTELESWIKDRMPESARDNHKVFGLFKRCIATLAYHRDWMEEHLHRNSMVRSSIFMIEAIPFAELVTRKHPWDATADTPVQGGLPPDTILLAELEGMKKKQEKMEQMIEELERALDTKFRDTLTSELDKRDIGGTGYVQSKEIFDKLSKLETLIKQPSSIHLQHPRDHPGEEDKDLLYTTGKGFVVAEYDIILELNNPDPTDTSAPTQLSAIARNRIVQERTSRQMSNRTVTMGHHHGQLNPLPSSWTYPKSITIIQLMNLWLIGIKDDKVPPLRMLAPKYVYHFDKNGRVLSKMNVIMRKIEEFGIEFNVWLAARQWDGGSITTLWSSIWEKLDPYLRTETRVGSSYSYEKSRRGQIAWRTCYNKMLKKGLFEGNKVRNSR